MATATATEIGTNQNKTLVLPYVEANAVLGSARFYARVLVKVTSTSSQCRANQTR